MNVFIAGAAGALGSRTIAALTERGHVVHGLTRSRSKGERLRTLGATPVYGDVLDRREMTRVLDEIRPGAVLQFLNALPRSGPKRPSQLKETNRLRDEGTRTLLAAAVGSGVRRYAVESMIGGYGYDHPRDALLTEDDRFGMRIDMPDLQPAIDAIRSMEDQVLAATESKQIEGIVLRYGLFYGPGVASTEFMISLLRKRAFPVPGGGTGTLSWIHLYDGARAATTAIENAAPGSIYNVVDDEPVTFGEMTREMSRRLDLPKPFNVPVWLARATGNGYIARMVNSNIPVSNARAKDELGWKLRYPTYREGVASLDSTAVGRSVPA